jgi:hypothetical protein
LKTQVKKDKKTPSAQGRRRQVAMVAVNSVLFNILYFITSYENSEELYLLPQLPPNQLCAAAVVMMISTAGQRIRAQPFSIQIIQL